MSKRKKAHQEQTYEQGDTSVAPHFAGIPKQLLPLQEGETVSATKKQKSEEISDRLKQEAFENAIEDYIRSRLEKIYHKPAEVEVLKQSWFNCTKLPPGIYSNAAKSLSTKAKEVTKHIQSHPTKLPAVLFADHAKKCFDAIKEDLTNPKQQGTPGSIGQELAEEFSALETGSPMSLDPATPEASTSAQVFVPATSIEPAEPRYATCTTSLHSILRKDLRESVKSSFVATMHETIADASDLVGDYSTLILSLIVCLKSHGYFQESDQHPVTLRQQQGFPLRSIFPENYELQTDIQYSVPPIPAELLASDAFTRQLETLFTRRHFEYISTSFTSTRRITDTRAATFELQRTLNSVLPETMLARLTSLRTVAPIVRNLAIDQYITNFENMWNSNTLINKALNKVLNVLLKIHLSPIRHQEYLEYVNALREDKAREYEERQNRIEEHEHNIGFLTRDHQRSIIRDETYKLNKHKKKAENAVTAADFEKWRRRQENARNRIERLKADIEAAKEFRRQRDVVQEGPVVLTEVDIDPLTIAEANEEITNEEAVAEEDETPPINTDASRRRLKQLVSVIRNLLFKAGGRSISNEDIQKVSPEILDNELAVCKLIANSLLPYLPPSKRTYQITAYQLHFVLLANDILRAAGYGGSTVAICPIPASSNLQSFRLNSTVIFSLFRAIKKVRKFLVYGHFPNADSTGLSRTLNNLDVPSDVELVVAPDVAQTDNMTRTLKDEISVAADTGQVLTRMLRGKRGAVSWVVIGHSEDRESQSNAVIANMALKVVSADGVSAIVCVVQREANQRDDLIQQLDALSQKIVDWRKIVIAYEPVWATTTNTVVTPDYAQETHAFIREWLRTNVTSTAAKHTRIIYGGPVNDKNCKKFASKPDIDGFFIFGDFPGNDFQNIVTCTQTIKFYDFEGEEITNTTEAPRLKDPLFNSFFDIANIHKVCQKDKLTFAHNVTILPGAKYVRILGTKTNKTASIKSSSLKKVGAEVPWPEIVAQQEKDDDTLTTEILDLENEIKRLTRTLVQQKQIFNEFDYPGKIKEARKDKLTDNVKTLQRQRFQSLQAIKKITFDLKGSRYSQYIRRKAVSSRDSVPQQRQREKQTIAGQPLLNKSENLLLPATQNIDTAFAFCGTDNGLVKITESIPLTFRKFRYHLELYNRFSPLLAEEQEAQQEEEAEAEEVERPPAALHVPPEREDQTPFEKLPETFAVSPGDIDMGCGYLRDRKRLEKMKRKDSGRQVTQIEEEIKQYSFHQANNIGEVERCYERRQQDKSIRRDFYYSNAQVRLKQKTELTAKKFKDRLCAKERLFCKGEGAPRNKKLIMLIGDRGYGYGSPIKGHKRYGRYWKQEKHAKYTTVCVTNENNTSQTCVYCFHKLYHPQKQVIIHGEQVQKNVNGAFLSYNPDCLSFKNSQNTQTRDKVSAMAIALSGMATIIERTLPPFTTRISQYNTEEFNRQTTVLLNRSADWAGSGAL